MSTGCVKLGLSAQPTAAQVATLTKQAHLDALLQRCGSEIASGSGSSGRGGAAAWGACMVLATDKATTSPLYLSLAANFNGKLAFGEARKGTQALADKLSIARCVKCFAGQ